MNRSLGSVLLQQPFWHRFVVVQLGFAVGGSAVVVFAWQLTTSEEATWIVLAVGLIVLGLIGRSRHKPSQRDVSRLTSHWTSSAGAILILVALDVAYLLPTLRPLRTEVRRLGGPTLLSWLFIVVTLAAIKATFLALEVRQAKQSA